MNSYLESGLDQVLARFGIDSQALLGQGGESWVVAIDNERIGRICRPGTSRAQVDGRTALLASLRPVLKRSPLLFP